MEASVDGKLSYNPIETPVITQVLSDKLSNSSSRDLYTHCRVNLATYPANLVAPQFVNHGFSTVNTLNKGSRICIPATRARSLLNISHWSAEYHAVGKRAAVGNTMGAKSYYSEENYKTDFEIWRKIANFSLSKIYWKDSTTFELDTTDSIPKDPESDTNFPDSSSIDSDWSDNRYYKRIRHNKEKNNQKLKKQDPTKLYSKLT